jgi:hypothetical protein
VITQTPVQLLASTPLVFAGEVLAVDTVILDPEPFIYRVRVRVQEAFKGTAAGEQVFDFSSTVESFRFEKGQRVLVFARRDQRGQFSTQCSATRLTTPNDREVAELRRLARP